MFKNIFSSSSAQNKNTDKPMALWQPEESGLGFSTSLAEDEKDWQLVSYLDQLVEEDFAEILSDRWLLSWDAIHQILNNEDHASSLSLLALPPVSLWQPILSSRGSLVDPDFKVHLAWRDALSHKRVEVDRIGALVRVQGQYELLSDKAWALTQAIRDLYNQQQVAPGEVTNQLGWSAIRKLGKQASAAMDGFLDKTVVVKPSQLKLKPQKRLVGNTPVIELDVGYEGQPENWLKTFDSYTQVQDRYRVPNDDGSITHVLIEPEVKSVLESVRELPGRRIAGDAAVSLLRNPFSFIGDDAIKVIDPDEYQETLADEGIYFHRFRLQPKFKLDAAIESVDLVLEPIASLPLEEIVIPLREPRELAALTADLDMKLAAGFPAGSWQGYELELSDFNLDQLNGIKDLLKTWQQQVNGAVFESVIDLASYGDRVIGIGEAEPIKSPFLVKESTENWLPDELTSNAQYENFFSQWNASDRQQFNQFERNLDEARAAGDDTVDLPGFDLSLPLKDAEQLHKAWSKKINTDSNVDTEKEKSKRAVLHIEQNIEEATYAQRRSEALVQSRAAQTIIPTLLRPEIALREHQLKGVAWMQSLFEMSPTHVAGCLLADDMGLGKTIQLLTFIVWYLEQYPEGKPALIVAPVSLLDNWERELQRFFYADALPVLKLYGDSLSAVKFHKSEISAEVRAKGIKNLLRPGWIGDARIVLTTYETLRDQEFSLAMQQWSIMVCDEAQKIKNPAALVAQSAKAIASNVQFKVACTGTPVENTLLDLWSIFEFIQPGLLGGMNQFGREYLKPIESGTERDTIALERLRSLIEPQTLRRTKQDVAKDLPAKIIDESCRSLKIHSLQRDLYLSEVANYTQKKQMKEALDQHSNDMLMLLQRLKLVCAHPYIIKPDLRLRETSPKLMWLLKILDKIKCFKEGDKVIIFSDRKDVQRELQYIIHDRYRFKATIINGDTSASSKGANSRQKLIDEFQQKSGFSVIILSPIAVGFGVNVQAANHVIHFTRCWNPAKEDQATDRAYRIGQEKNVYVYYPTVLDSQMPTFEWTLDQLLEKRRELAKDMLHGSADIQASDFLNSI